MGLVAMSEASEAIALGNILPMLKNAWGIDQQDQAIFGTVIFLGIGLGSLFQGIYSDKFGRKSKFTVFIATLLQNFNKFSPHFITL